MDMAIIGLGKMGKALALQALGHGIKVVGMTHGEADPELLGAGLVSAASLKELLTETSSPRKIFLYIPAGSAVEAYITQFKDVLDEGDIVIDSGNSYWGDSMRRYKILREKGIHFIDLGTSGGVSGARNGACFMAGGDREAYDQIEPILKEVATENAYAYVGPAGCGHLIKLIHNGIEFGMLQAIGEGMALLDRFETTMKFDMESVFKVYRHGSVIRSWLVDLMEEQFFEQEGFSVPPYIEDTGEVNWLLEDALHLEVPTPVIAQSLMELFRSRDKTKVDYRAIAMMRHGFGGHPFGEKEELKVERRLSRIDPTFPESSYGH